MAHDRPFVGQDPFIGRAPFVGRDEELARLARFYSAALSGNASVCFVSGEPGAGKTSLVEHFARRIQEENPATVVARGGCNASTGVGDPYLPFREILAQLSGDVGEDLEQGRMSEENASRLRQLARASARAFVESGPDLLDLFVPGASLLARLGGRLAPDAPWGRRAATADPEGSVGQAPHAMLDQEEVFEQFTNLLDRLARKEPLVLLLEDLHWADKATVALLFHLYRCLGRAPLLMVGTYRPTEVSLGRDGERHPLEPVLNEIKRYEGDVRVDLDARSEESRRRLFESLVDLLPNRLDEGFRDALFRRTRGHPLFTLELLRHLRNEGSLRQDEEGRWTADAAPDWAGLPARVEGVIGERLARLDEDLQEALRVASVEGERFRAPVVARVLELDERDLVRRLGAGAERKHGIVRSEGLRRIAGRRIAEYRFAHSLFQTYLYDSIDEAERAYLHEEVGEALEELYGDRTREIAPELARHFEAARVPEKAVEYRRAAGENAMELFATAEAIRHFQSALEQLERLPEEEERDRTELDLQERLGSCQVAAEGYGSPRTRAAYERARTLCERLGQETDPPILRALSISDVTTGNMGRAHELAGELMELARHEGNPVWIVEGHYAMGVTCFWLGRFATSREHLEQGCERYRPELAGVHTSLYAQNPEVVCLCRLAWTLWYLGYPDRAFERMEESVVLAREFQHPHSLAYALNISACLYIDARSLERAEEVLDELLALGDRRALPFWMHRERIERAWVEAVRDDARDGIGQIKQCMSDYREDGNFLKLTWDFGRLAELHLRRGEFEEGLEALSEAFALSERTEEGFYVAELHRLRGELLLARNADEAGAAASFRRGLELARQQDARWLELRSAISLGRVWHDRDRKQDARDLVRGVVGGLAEGSRTLDVIEARALLEEWA